MRDERGTQRERERELSRSSKKEDSRELQPSALGNWDGLRWYVVCRCPRTRCLSVNDVIPPPLRGNLFSVPHIHSPLTPLTHKIKTISHPKRWNDQKERQGHSTLVLISYTVQCVEKNTLNLRSEDCTERMEKGETFRH